MVRSRPGRLLFHLFGMNIFLIILALLGLIPVVMLIAGLAISAPRYRGPSSDHFDGTRFFNPGHVRAKGGWDLVKWMLSRKTPRWEEDRGESYGPHPLGHFKGGIRITFVNHSTFLIQVDGVNVLTDPVWSRRVSPWSWIGPKRKRLPGIRFGDLPRIHVVLISHNHYDHLDIETMRMVCGAHHPTIVAPLGVKRYLDKCYLSGAVELDWWKEMQRNGLAIKAVPAQHFSGRGLLDRDATLWCGYVIRSSEGNLYFSGDTGYNDTTFRDIRAACGPMKVSMLPIGAYKPTWFMSPIHVSPEESVMIHRDVGSEVSIGMHFGTFQLADDGGDDPVTDLQIAKEKFGLNEDEFIVLKEGEARVFE